MKIHSGKPKYNKAYSSLLKTNCLIIGYFAETTIYDESILESMHRLLETRAKVHQNSYIQHKYNPKKAFTPLCTIITSSYQPVDWTKIMVQDAKKTFGIARLFYQSYATTIHIDETNKPDS